MFKPSKSRKRSTPNSVRVDKHTNEYIVTKILSGLFFLHCSLLRMTSVVGHLIKILIKLLWEIHAQGFGNCSAHMLQDLVIPPFQLILAMLYLPTLFSPETHIPTILPRVMREWRSLSSAGRASRSYILGIMCYPSTLRCCGSLPELKRKIVRRQWTARYSGTCL